MIEKHLGDAAGFSCRNHPLLNIGAVKFALIDEAKIPARYRLKNDRRFSQK
jgi:hypothetical protein